MPARLHRFVDRGGSGFSNIELASGQRVLVSVAQRVTRGGDPRFPEDQMLVAHSLRIHDLHLFGRFPGRTVFAADDAVYARLVRHVAAGRVTLADLPASMALDRLLTGAIDAIEHGEPFDPDRDTDADLLFGEPESVWRLELDPLPWLTRLVLAQPDRAALQTTLRRLAATPA
jgi:hypothetical protein